MFGVQGWLKLRSHTSPPEAILNYLPWSVRLRSGEQTVADLRSRTHSKGLQIKLPGVDDRDAAEAWVGALIHVERSVLPPAGPGEYYWTDLEGLAVRNVDGADFGRVSHLFATAGNDVLVVRGERERLIPFLQPDVVKSVDLVGGQILVDWDPEF